MGIIREGRQREVDAVKLNPQRSGNFGQFLSVLFDSAGLINAAAIRAFEHAGAPEATEMLCASQADAPPWL